MIQLSSIVQYLDSLLTPEAYSDYGFNGLQVESSNQVVKKICVAVDSGMSVLEEATKENADLLIVHHGLFWGSRVYPITGIMGKKVDLLLRSGCSLYASHLPLDGNQEVGNGFELARKLGLEDIRPFCEYEGNTIGAKGKFMKARPMQELIEPLQSLHGAIPPYILPFGPDEVKSVAVVTGSGSLALETCAQEGIDLLISGEAKQESYHLARELNMNALFAGHYATETVGVLALKERVERQFDLQGSFIDIPTGI